MALEKNFEFNTSRTNQNVWNASGPDKAYFQQFGYEMNEMHMDDQRRYSVNVYDNIFYSSPKSLPTWTLMAISKKEKMTNPYLTWGEDYNGASIKDNSIDDLRLRGYDVMLTGHTGKSGKLFFNAKGSSFNSAHLLNYTSAP